MLISLKKPFHAVSDDTVRRWIKDLLQECNIFNFSAHSCRSAATSKAKVLGVDIDLILEKACWKNEGTFRKHYDKLIISNDNDTFIKILDC